MTNENQELLARVEALLSTNEGENIIRRALIEGDELAARIKEQAARPASAPKICTTSGEDPAVVRARQAEEGNSGQHSSYLVLCSEEREKGFVRPVRTSYKHVGIPGPKYPLRDPSPAEAEYARANGYIKYEDYPESERPLMGRWWNQAMLDKIDKGCRTVTTMGQALSETYARNPSFYGSTFCCGCGAHLPVGEDGEFVWTADGSRVGT